MNWRTTNLAKFIVASPKAILPLFSPWKQRELSQTMPTKFHRDESQDKLQTKNFSQNVLFIHVCIIHTHYKTYSTLHKYIHTSTHLSVFVCVDDRLCPIVISWCAYKVLVYLELLHFCAYVIYFQTSFWNYTTSLEYTILMFL